MHSKMIQRILAIFLIITLTFANPLLITKSFAASLFEDTGDTGSKNVDFTASFNAEDDNNHSAIYDVNSQDLAINLKVNVKDKGYLKNAKVEVLPANGSLNFALKGNAEEPEKEVESVEGVASLRRAELTGSLESDIIPSNNDPVVPGITTSSNDTGLVSEEMGTSEIVTQEQVLTIPEVVKEESNVPQVPEQTPATEEKAPVQEVPQETVQESETPITVLNDMVESVEGNTIKLKQISSKSEVRVSLPFKYVNEQYINRAKVNSYAKVLFTGIYVNEKGEEVELNKAVDMQVMWEDNSNQAKLASEITKYIPYVNGDKTGIILQTVVRLSNETVQNTLPVLGTEVKVVVPELDGVKPTINLVANRTTLTNGKSFDNVVFGNENWEYDSASNTLTIKSSNNEQEVVINQNNDIIKDETVAEVKENRLYSLSGTDEYTLTYVYENVAIKDDLSLSSKVSAKVNYLSGNVNDTDNTKVKETNEEFNYHLTGQVGDIVSYSVENLTDSYYKSYIYLNNNNQNPYEVVVNEKEIINISLKDIVSSMTITDVNSYYTLKDGNRVDTNDFKYNKIEISKENFDKILGENGSIKVQDLAGNVLAEINGQAQADETGIININLSNLNINKVQITATNPVADGDLILNIQRAVRKSEFSKDDYTRFEAITFESRLNSKYNYVGDSISNGTKYSTTLIRDTQTKINLVVDREALSTIVNNENVEIRVELNNDKEASDIYGHSTFRIEMPEYIESMNIKNANIVYGEGLDITNAYVQNEDGKVVIYIVVDGKQEYLNSGLVTNGTNLVINADIKVNLFAPAAEQEIKAQVVNDEATIYSDEGKSVVKVLYSAPSGVLTVAATKNYDKAGSMITSVHQGKMEDTIEIFAEPKTATMDVVVMNNNNNTVSDISILGRIPFKGVKDLATGEDLGTTSDTQLAGLVKADELNRGEFKVYYSTNENATKLLDDPENEWKENPEDLGKVKSYLIIPVEKDYTMNKAEVVRFSYEYIIPGDLQHNESFYGTFMAYYVNNTDVAKIDETSEADIVGLTTGEGPEITFKYEANKKTLKEFEEIKYTAIVENVGTSVAKNVKVTLPVPNNTEFVDYEVSNGKAKVDVNDNTANAVIEDLDAKEKIEITITVRANELPIVDELGRNVNNELEIKSTSTVTADDLQKTLKSEEIVAKIVKAELEVSLITPEERTDLEPGEDFVYYRSNPYVFYGEVMNLTDNKVTNLKASVKLPAEFDLDRAYIMGYEEDGLTVKEIKDGVKFDEVTREISWTFDSINGSRAANFAFVVTVGTMPDGVTRLVDKMTLSAKADGTEEYYSNEIKLPIAVPQLEITQTTNTKNTYVKEGQTIEYVFNIKNTGNAVATNVKLTDKIPDGLKVQSATYTVAGNTARTTSLNGKDVVINANLRPNEEMVANVKAIAQNLNGMQEKTVSNNGSVQADFLSEKATNTITHIVEADEENRIEQDEDTSGATGTSKLDGMISSTEKRSQNTIVKTYKVTGRVWLDANHNGMRDAGEYSMNANVSLINVDNGNIVKKAQTSSSGDYTLSGVENGKYMVLFDYDTTLYTATLYKQEGIADDVNSDAVTTKIEQDGTKRNAAVTDVITINDLSLSNIDLGLVNAQKFDLSVNKVITKMTSQSSNSTNTETFGDGSKLSQMPIAGKYVASTVVYIEYKITVKNEGDVAGFAKKVVDYVPNGMQFNSSLNEDWYSGNDGNLYSSALADVELQPGEERTLKLVLQRQMTVDNTDIVSNQAEIAEDYNIYGVSDINSTPMNRAQRENDLSKADAILTIKTGETLIYTSVIITIVIVAVAVIGVAYVKIVKPKSKGGV